MAKVYLNLLVALLMVVLMGTSAWAASITGSVTNSTGKTGRIYLSLRSQNGGFTGLGTSIAAAGAFTINGVQSGVQYTVQAFVDTQGTGVQHANDPKGTSTTVTATSGSVSVGTFAVRTLPTVAAQSPQVVVTHGNGGNFLIFGGPEDDNGNAIADKYTVSWSASATGSPIAGSKDISTGKNDFFVHVDGASSLYYQVTAVAGGTTAASAWTPVSTATGTGSVTGKILFTGVTASGPLIVALAKDSLNGPPTVYPLVIKNPVSGTSFTFSNVPAGTYQVYPFVDLNNSGTYDPGDISLLDSNSSNPMVTVSSSQATVPDITLVTGNAYARVNTQHGKSRWGEWYNLSPSVESIMKQVVAVQVSGPQIPSAIDLALDGGSFEGWMNVDRPSVGDAYQVKVTYLDGTSENLYPQITAVLDGFAQPITPVGIVPFNATPTFSWNPPSPAPADFTYGLWVNTDNYGSAVWDAWEIPSSQTSIPYGSQGDVYQADLSDGTTYNYSLSVRDKDGNSSLNQVSFTPTNAPAVSGFSPAGGLPGTTVTITGSNFNPDPTTYIVYFNGVPATVSSATGTLLTVTVPEGASTGRIQVNAGAYAPLLTATDFIVAAPVNYSGVVTTSGGVKIAGARVERIDDASIYTTTASDGSFTLSQLFQGQYVAFKITKSGFVPTYTSGYYLQDSLDLTSFPSHLYTQTEFNGWGISAGKGAVVGTVLNTRTTPYSPVGNVLVKGKSNAGIFYPVKYNTGTTFGGTSTYTNGVFLVSNVNDNDMVTVSATKSLWSFQDSYFPAHANSVVEGVVLGVASFPSVFDFSPASGKAGTSVVISGANFSSIPTENIVAFNGAKATVTAANATSLTVTVPAGATTGPVSVTTAGGTVSSYWFTMRYTLSASITGSGGALGTVTSIPGGISCRTTGCTAEFDQGTLVELITTADGGGVFSAFGGACTGAGTCSLFMDADKSVTATFASLRSIKTGVTYYPLLQYAFDAAITGDTIQAQAVSFTEASLTFDRPGVQAKIRGGYDSSFQNSGGYTTVDGRLNIQGGTLRAERLKIK